MIGFLIEEGEDSLKLAQDRSRTLVDPDRSGLLEHPLFDPSGEDPNTR